MDPCSSYSTSMTSARKLDYRKRKRVQRSPVSCGRDAPDKIKDSAFVPQEEHQIRTRSDERNKGIHRSAHSRADGGLVEALQQG